MIAMLDTSEDLAVCEAELGCPVEQLLTPLTRFALKTDGFFGVDNGGYSGLDIPAFLSLLAREYLNRARCRFVACPDVVASAIRTLELFEYWRYKLSAWPLALVIQDGQESLPIPWSGLNAIFIGGSTEFKMGKHAGDCIRAAKAMDKWVHVGRVNTPGRFEYFERLGVDSIDGTGLARYSWMRERIYESARQPHLFSATEVRM